jgi:hypothetical protein
MSENKLFHGCTTEERAAEEQNQPILTNQKLKYPNFQGQIFPSIPNYKSFWLLHSYI